MKSVGNLHEHRRLQLMYTVTLSESDMEFLRQLLKSDLPISINSVESVAAFKAKILTAQPDAP